MSGELKVDEMSYVSYIDENDIKREGYFTILEANGLLFKLKGKYNIITIPYTRILKIKEKLKGDEDGATDNKG